MSVLYRNGISPTRHSYPPPFQTPLLQPLGYILESRTPRRHEISTLKALRKEINAVQNCERLFVIRNRDVRVLEVLGVDASASTWGGETEQAEWIWEYPDIQGSSLRFLNVSLYSRDNYWILLIDPTPHARPLPPRLKHQDAATRKSTFRTASYHTSSHQDPVSLDEFLCQAFNKEEPLPKTLGELVFERWTAFLSSLNQKDTPFRKELCLYRALQALEADEDSLLRFKNSCQQAQTPTLQDVAILLNRLHRHIQLLPRQTQPSPATPSASDRALNRISYIGGLLLPVTVVSSVLAIEGDYGPEGGNFWVFWVASAVVSLVAVGLIHIDEVRGAEVWREVAEEIGFLTEDGGDGDDDEVGNSSKGVRDGHGLVWERRELGWGGAFKKVSGYYRLRGTKGLKFDRPDGK